MTISELEARVAATAGPDVPPRERVDALVALAWELRSDEIVRAHALATEARELAIEHEYKLGQANAARTMAMSISDTDAMPRLLMLAEEAKQLFDEVGDASGRARARDFLASVYEFLGETTLALELAVDALTIARELGDPVRLGYALSNVGGILAVSSDVDAGLERLKEALQLFETAGDLDGVATICSRLCRALQKAGRPEEALAYAERCREVSEQTNNEWSLGAAVSVMAEIEDERGRPDEAERLYRAALAGLTTEPVRNLLGSTVQVALGRLLIRQGALAAAEVELNDALRRIERNSVSAVTETDANEALAELCERQGDLAAAILHLRKAQAVRGQLAERNARNKLAQVEARAAMEATRKDAEIHKLRFVELHGMQTKLVQAERMALLGTLAAGAAHELNTPLGVLSSNIQLSAVAAARLLALAGGDEELRAQAAKLVAVIESCRQSSEQAVQRISEVARSFGRFTQLDRAELRTFDVREGLDSAMALLAPTIAGSITLERRFEEVPAIDAWARELNQAFMTVLENAVQAIDGAGVVVAETSATPEHVIVRVRDDGRGMTAEKAAHLFDIAWSEEGDRTSMRMGLCAAYATTQRHGGTMSVESTLGRGTTVTFTFPIRGRSGV